MAKKAVYAVKTGRVPGLYDTWDACQEQVKGFSGAEYQKFKTEEEANAYLNGTAKKAPTAVPAAPAAEQKPIVGPCYGVKVGKTPGVYQTWEECKDQIDGYPGAKYKKFPTYEDAVGFVTGKEVVSEKKPQPESVTPEGPYAFVDGSFNPKTSVYGYGGFLCVDGKKYPLQGKGTDPSMAAMRNVAGEIEGAMAAVRKAEELKLPDLTILYDYKGIEEWAKPTGGWKANEEGTKAYAAFMRSPERLTQVSFQKVAAHTGIEGNEMADVMAKNAVGIPLTQAQEDLLMKGLTMRKRNGLEDLLDVPDMESELEY